MRLGSGKPQPSVKVGVGRPKKIILVGTPFSYLIFFTISNHLDF